MKQINQHRSHLNVQTNHRYARSLEAHLREQAILRDMAFVLKMTEKVRTEIENKPQAHATVTA